MLFYLAAAGEPINTIVWYFDPLTQCYLFQIQGDQQGRFFETIKEPGSGRAYPFRRVVAVLDDDVGALLKNVSTPSRTQYHPVGVARAPIVQMAQRAAWVAGAIASASTVTEPSADDACEWIDETPGDACEWIDETPGDASEWIDEAPVESEASFVMSEKVPMANAKVKEYQTEAFHEFPGQSIDCFYKDARGEYHIGIQYPKTMPEGSVEYPRLGFFKRVDGEVLIKWQPQVRGVTVEGVPMEDLMRDGERIPCKSFYNMTHFGHNIAASAAIMRDWTALLFATVAQNPILLQLVMGPENAARAQEVASCMHMAAQLVTLESTIGLLEKREEQALQSLGRALRDQEHKDVVSFEWGHAAQGIKSFDPLWTAEGVLDAVVDTQEKAICADGCHAAYELERHNRSGAAADASEWIPVRGAYDIAMVYKNVNNVLYLAFRGSMKRDDCKHWDDRDWVHNFTCAKQDPRVQGLGLEGEMHAGFLQKYKEMQANLYMALQGVSFNADTRVVVTGHSLGAAVAQIAAADLCSNILPKIYNGFDNAEQNRLRLVALAAPRVATAAGVEWMERVVGRYNAIRVNVLGDPVAMAPLSVAGGVELRKKCVTLPNGINALVDRCSGYVPFGGLVLAPAVAAIQSNMGGIFQAVALDRDPMAVIKQLLAPIHIGGRGDSGRTQFDPAQVKAQNFAALLLISFNQDEETKFANMFRRQAA